MRLHKINAECNDFQAKGNLMRSHWKCTVSFYACCAFDCILYSPFNYITLRIYEPFCMRTTETKPKRRERESTPSERMIEWEGEVPRLFRSVHQFIIQLVDWASSTVCRNSKLKSTQNAIFPSRSLSLLLSLSRSARLLQSVSLSASDTQSARKNGLLAEQETYDLIDWPEGRDEFLFSLIDTKRVRLNYKLLWLRLFLSRSLRPLLRSLLHCHCWSLVAIVVTTSAAAAAVYNHNVVVVAVFGLAQWLDFLSLFFAFIIYGQVSIKNRQ